MKFRTEIHIDPLPAEKCINHRSKILMMGSCFSENVGAILQKYLFNISVNPFGVTYNPMSIMHCIENLQEKKDYEEKDLEFHNELWFSYDHYTLFSDPDKQKTLNNINTVFRTAKLMLEQLDFLIITFGTSWVYSKKKDGIIVNNCHKIPAKEFDRRSLTVDEIVESYSDALEKLKSKNPNIKLILTVSPVRHIKDGLIGNQASKATLLLASRELAYRYPENCIYFPSYEIMMDDLRDYRYYASDMIHPNEQAIEYIWDSFSSLVLSKQSREICKVLDPVLKATSHIAVHQNTEAYKKFKLSTENKISQIRTKYPFLAWNKTT